ncbi:unnamed protein product [Sphagnum compactum]
MRFTRVGLTFISILHKPFILINLMASSLPHTLARRGVRHLRHTSDTFARRGADTYSRRGVRDLRQERRPTLTPHLRHFATPPTLRHTSDTFGRRGARDLGHERCRIPKRFVKPWKGLWQMVNQFNGLHGIPFSTISLTRANLIATSKHLRVQVSSKSLNGTEYGSNKEVKGLLSSFPRKAVWQLTLLHHGEEQENSVVWTLVSSKSLNGTEHLLPRFGLNTQSPVVAFLLTRYKATELEGRNIHLLARGLQTMESHLQMLRDLTMDRMGNSVLSDDVTLESLASITENLSTLELEQLVINAKRSALYR